MTPDEFIAKWAAADISERASAQTHFNDLCKLLGVAAPNDDPDDDGYAFEKRITKSSGGRGFADVWKRNHFALEYKAPGGLNEKAFEQLLRYAPGLENPPILAVCDILGFELRTNFNNTPTRSHRIHIVELRDANRRRLLHAMLVDPEALRPPTTRAGITKDAAEVFIGIARRLRDRGHPPIEVAHFVNRLVFCLFADKAKLLPNGMFRRILERSRRAPQRFQQDAALLFTAMRDPDGSIGFDEIPWFNGGLFDSDATLPLTMDDIKDLLKASIFDWDEIEPSIFGTLFERALDPAKESQIGRHYTDEAKIDLILEPVLVRPLTREWAAARERIAAIMERHAPLLAADAAAGAAALAAPDSRAARAALDRAARARRAEAQSLLAEAEAILDAWLARLRAFRVLDPACGSGNFLYVALLRLKDLERQAVVEAEGFGLPRREVQIGPEVVLGIELNAFAAELARVSVWIGAIQWTLRNGYVVADNPILKKLDHIECRDALLNPDGTEAAWPKADVIVGNPPFVGDKKMLKELGAASVDRLRTVYTDRVPGGADLVCFWFEKARAALAAGDTQRVGLVSTNSIRSGANRRVLDRIVKGAKIFSAWGDEPWILDGAAVRVSLVCFCDPALSETPCLNGQDVPIIFPDLTAAGADLTAASMLAENASAAFNGIQKTGPFELTGELARQWLVEPLNPNGRPNSDVVRPWWNGLDVARRNRDMWIVDFGTNTDEVAVRFYVAPYGHLAHVVKPTRVGKREKRTNECWWLFQWSRPVMREALSAHHRFIVTPEVSKHRVFVWAPAAVCPDTKLQIIARSDDTSFGILHSRFHETWAVRLGASHGVGNDPRYTPSTSFETFPFPEHLTPNLPAESYAANPHAIAIAEAARALVAARDAWLNPPDLVDCVPEVVPGFPDRIVPKSPAAAVTLRRRTLTALYNTRGTPEGAWLDGLHAALDTAVAAAYGFPSDITEEDALARLLALNQARAAAQGAPRRRR